MIGDLRASLYDFFGYLLPGLVAAAGLTLLVQVLSRTPHIVWLNGLPETVLWTSLLLGAYVVGHAVHALGNAIPSLSKSAETLALGPNGLPSPIVQRGVTALASRLGVDASQLSPDELFALIDETRVHRGSSGDRDVYVYREGFYRGMTIATAVLALGLVVHAWSPTLCLALEPQAPACVTRASVLACAAVSALCSWAFVRRMKRFGRYRVQRGLYQFVLDERATGTGMERLS